MIMKMSPLVAALALVVACTAAPPPPSAPAQNTSPAPPPPAAPQLGVLSAAARATDKGPGQHNYTELYERLFLQWKDEPIKIFEIGVAEGGSLKMWQAYFPKARIYGIDIFDKSAFNNGRVTTLIADQANRDQLQAAIGTSGSDIDVLIDDGGHTMEQQQVSLGFLFRHGGRAGNTSSRTCTRHYRRCGRDMEWRPTAPTPRSACWRITCDPHRRAIRSRYMREAEMAYLTANIESVLISHRPQSRSIMAVLKKKS